MHRPAALFALCLGAAPAAAIEARVHFTCAIAQSCRVGEACLYAHTSFTMVLDGDHLAVILGGATATARYNPELRTAAFQADETVYQMRFTGDGTGVLFATRDGQAFEESQVLWLNCESP